MKLLRRVLLLLTAIMLLTVCVQAAGVNSVTVLHSRDGLADSGVVFDLYRVQDSFTDPMAAYVAVLEAGKTPAATAQTDSGGKAVFSGLAEGSYLLTGRPYAVEDAVIELEMSLLKLPVKTGNGSGNALVVMPKHSSRPNTSGTGYRVLILWEDAWDTSRRPDSVSVQLFRNGEKHSLVRPDKAGNWQYLWTEEDPLAMWAVLEQVPDHYRASYSRNGNTFVITNTLKPVDTAEEGDGLPQTGQLWWPVPLLALTGSFLFLAGWLRRKEFLNAE